MKETKKTAWMSESAMKKAAIIFLVMNKYTSTQFSSFYLYFCTHLGSTEVTRCDKEIQSNAIKHHGKTLLVDYDLFICNTTG